MILFMPDVDSCINGVDFKPDLSTETGAIMQIN